VDWLRTRTSDTSTRTAREIRRTLVRWFLLLGAACCVLVALLAGGLAVAAGLPWSLAALIAAVAVIPVAVLGSRGLDELLEQVDRLDHERHGLMEAYDRARLDALRDGLTGLGNHRAFQEELEEQIRAAREQERPFALLYVDVDDLKSMNDANGHAAGDDALRALARMVATNLRRWDRGFRIGGDEFAVILIDCGPDEAMTIGRRILASALDGGAGTYGVAPFSVTVGVSAFPDLAKDRQQLMHQADAALYWGKRHGRTDVQLFDPTRHGMAEDWRPLDELAAAVSRVAANRLLTPVYQPIHSLKTGAVMGYEGLVRPTADAGFTNSTSLFVAAETTRRTVELDLASLEAVLHGARSLDEHLYLSVNLSPRTLEAEAFRPVEVLSLARRYGIDPTRLVVELTEREAVEDLARLREAMATLRRHGVRTAADDVGAGNAGLRLLSELHFDIMKIDLTLVRAGAASDAADAVLRALAGLARRQGQVIVAEGIETAAELEVVLELRFDAGQGYLLRRPGPLLDAKPVDLLQLAGLRPCPVASAAPGPAVAAPG
jgi:diguanylate cyclase (GGDEF)-like protein